MGFTWSYWFKIKFSKVLGLKFIFSGIGLCLLHCKVLINMAAPWLQLGISFILLEPYFIFWFFVIHVLTLECKIQYPCYGLCQTNLIIGVGLRTPFPVLCKLLSVFSWGHNVWNLHCVTNALTFTLTIYFIKSLYFAGICSIATSSSWWFRFNNKGEISCASPGCLWSAWLSGYPLFLLTTDHLVIQIYNRVGLLATVVYSLLLTNYPFHCFFIKHLPGIIFLNFFFSFSSFCISLSTSVHVHPLRTPSILNFFLSFSPKYHNFF